MVVTGTLSALSQSMLGISLHVIDHAALRAEPVRAAVDALRNTTGVFIDEANGPLGPTIIRLRGGEETFTQVLVNGVQINENGGFFDAQGLTLVNIDRIEVARGPQSAIYGSSAMSGVVQMFMRAGEPGRMRTDAAIEGLRARPYGGGFRGFAEASGGSNLLRYAIGGGSAYERGPYRLPQDLHSNDASLRLDLVSSGPFRLTGVSRYMGVTSLLPVRNPGVTRAPLDPNQRQGRERIIGSLEGMWTPSDHWSHELSVSGYRRGFSYDDTKDQLDPKQYPFFIFDANYHYNAVVERTTARYVGTVSGAPAGAAGSSFSLAYGGQWERETLRDTASGDYGPAAMRVARPSVAGFTEAQAHFADRLSLLVGSRVEKFEGLDAAFVPRASAVLSLVPNRLSVRSSVGRAYKAPNIQDQFPNNPYIMANPDLRPETSTSWEVGADVAAARATGSVVFFRQRYDNLIRSVNADASGKQINRNLGRSRVSGIEVEGEIRPISRWGFGAQGAWLGTKIIDNNGLPADQFPNGGSLPFRPSYTASGFARVEAARDLSLTLRATSIGRQTVLTERFRGGRVSIDPYTVMTLSGAYNLTHSFEAYVHAENLLDTGYETAYDRPGMPRSAAIGLRVRR